ncbi:MAG: hypothetical protein RQ966_06190 [Acetobacteraceae bacterium]|nr:hypothetical protein [Acetobacteraceae bacterium]
MGELLPRRRFASAVLAVWLTTGGIVFAAASVGGNDGTPDDELRIGGIKTYPSEEKARLACNKDPVVWADRYAGYIYFPRETQYGRTAQGAFACFDKASKGNYWTTGPMGSIGQGHGPGRQFPERFPPPTS